MGYTEHKEASEGRIVACAVVTVSDTRTEATDKSGAYLRETLEANGHKVVHYEILKDEPDQIRDCLDRLLGHDEPHAVICTGGTGIAKRDTTFDIVSAALDKTLPGFGEIFRYLSYQEIGSGAIMSRAVAGTYKSRVVLSVPGSTGAVRLAMEKLIIPELGHMVGQVSRRG